MARIFEIAPSRKTSESAELRLDQDVLLAESNHRIANNLSLIAAVARSSAFTVATRNRVLTAPELQGLLVELAGRIEAVAALHRLLSGAPRSGAISLGPYLRDVCAGIRLSLASATRFDTSGTDDSCVVPADGALSLALIVHELATNALKYAHPTGIAGTIAVSCGRAPDGALELAVEDDGVGLPEGMDPMNDAHSGLAMVRMLAQQIGAEIDHRSTPLGLRWTIRLAVE